MTGHPPWQTAPQPALPARSAGTALLPDVAVSGTRTPEPRRGGLRRALTGPPWPLLAVLAVQAGLSLRLIWTNTAFMDEGLYLQAGHLELAHWLHGAPVPAFQTYFSGAPVLYPPLGALASTLGGLAGARLLSLTFMLGAAGLLYATTSRMFSRKAAVAAAAVFAVLGPVQDLGAFATYDAMAVFLTALAAWLVMRASGRLSEPMIAAAAVVMVVADATKYASALWDPAIIALVVTTAASGGWLRALARGGRAALYVTAAAAVALRAGGHSYWQGIAFTTLARTAGTTSANAVLSWSFSWIGAVFLLAVLGAGISVERSRRDVLTCAVLAVATVLAPAEQARIGTLTSLHKHVVFGAWFGAIAAGYALAWAADYSRAKGWRLAAVMLPLILVTGMYQAWEMFHGWPDIAAPVRVLAAVIPGSPGKCLASENNVISYYLPQQLPDPNRCTGSYSFGYWDAGTHQWLTGTQARVTAIRHHYFAWIEADPNESTSFYAPVNAAARAAGYRLVASLPDNSDNPSAPIEIWRYMAGRHRK